MKAAVVQQAQHGGSPFLPSAAALVLRPLLVQQPHLATGHLSQDPDRPSHASNAEPLLSFSSTIEVVLALIRFLRSWFLAALRYLLALLGLQSDHLVGCFLAL